MTFPEIIEKFKNHCYIRRECWPKNIFIQYCDNNGLIRMVEMENECSPVVLDNDVRMTAIDLLSDDWISLVKSVSETFWEYVHTLKTYSDEWRLAMEIGQQYHDSGKNPNDYLKEIKENIAKIKNAEYVKKGRKDNASFQNAG